VKKGRWDFRTVTIVWTRGTITNAKWVERLKLWRTRAARSGRPQDATRVEVKAYPRQSKDQDWENIIWKVRCKKRLRHNQKTLFWWDLDICEPTDQIHYKAVQVLGKIEVWLTCKRFDVLLTVHLGIILVINQLPMHRILFYNKFIICLYIFRALCAHHQEVKIVLYSIWYHHTCRWLSRAQVERERESSLNHTRCCIIQFWPSDDEYIVHETCRGI